MNNESINCPFCGEVISNDILKCPSCGSLFAEPELPGIKFGEFGIFMALTFLTGGLFSIIWFLINARPLNSLTINPKDKLKLNWLVALLIFDIIAFYTGVIKYSAAAITIIIMIALTYRALRIIQKYSKSTYDVLPEINPYYIGIFNVLYLVHYIDTYKNRILEIHENFNIQSPYMIALIVILIVIQCNCILNPIVYDFYYWLLKPIHIG